MYYNTPFNLGTFLTSYALRCIIFAFFEMTAH